MSSLSHPFVIHLSGTEKGMKHKTCLAKENVAIAKNRWPARISRTSIKGLRSLTASYHFSIATGDLMLLDGHWYVTHTGLLRLAGRRRCAGIHVDPVQEFSDPSAARWAFKATVFKSPICKDFVGYGDADPTNASTIVRGAELRLAETRAVNRALRKAYGIGFCSVEEIGSLSSRTEPNPAPRKLPPQSANGNGNGSPRVRDRLCQLIRQHSLDPELVKSYATDFCGTKMLKEATRAQVERFVEHLADWAVKDRNALLCQLNSYLARKEKKGTG
jgi:hypothetical protein